MGIHIKPAARPEGDRIAEIQSTAVPQLPPWVAASTHIPFRRATAHFDGAGGMDILTFQQRVFEAYQSVLAELEAGFPTHLARFWAFIPGIHEDLGAGLDRYMAFNAGRYAAFASHYGRPAAFDRSIPTASAVGVQGEQFVLHGLAAAVRGVPVENPRQVSAYHYSRRFGPMPPCFARATLLHAPTAEPLLIVGGTASITGEESRHLGDLTAQARETFHNLASVVASAAGLKLHEYASPTDIAPLLGAFTDIRVYHRQEADRAKIAALLATVFPASCAVEIIHASLCRSELLIEIEGLALPGRVIGRASPGLASQH